MDSIKQMSIGILQQWKLLFQWVHYKIFIQKKFNNLIKEVKIKEKEIDKITKSSEKILKEKIEDYNNIGKLSKEFIATLKHINNPRKSLKVYLISKEHNKDNKFKRFFRKLFKFDGYIFYMNKAEDWKIYKVKNLNFLHQLKRRELYNLHLKEGTYNGKPCYVVKYPLCISLNVDGEQLYYDAESYNNYVNTATKINLTNLNKSMNIGEFLKKNFIIILIIIAVSIFLLTPQGQEILSDLLAPK